MLYLWLKMSRNAVENWESVIHKSIRASDGSLVGSVDAVDDNSVLVSTEGTRTRYKIPKHIIEGYDGHEVFLKVEKIKLERFKGGPDEGFREVK
jgi:hypothetical protein